ncbi:MAG: M23 family metallopeptidase [Chlorobi bacterium]|nr:M23 family metallopeptidase [Chlorobiota bacterium]
MMILRTLLFLFIFLPVIPVQADDDTPLREKPLFTPPLRIPIFLSSNFMELRTDHFHSGIDIKTQGMEGKKVYSIADGYISRIRISISGFGKAVYITHPNGYTSVYGHLSRLAKKISPVVKSAQYKQKSYTVDLFFTPEDFPVNKGEVIGYSGNTGNSFGPHLHFEIRDTQTEHPVNPLKFRFPVKDTVAPVFKRLLIYPATSETFINNTHGTKSFSTNATGHAYTLKQSQPVQVTGPVSLGIEVQDYLDGSHNRCGIYDLQVLFDGKLIYHIVMDEFSYSTTRYINTLMDYGEKIRNGRNIIRTYISPNNRLNIYRTAQDHGIIQPGDMVPHHIEIQASDVYGNTSHLSFSLVRVSPPLDQTTTQNNPESCSFMLWNRENRFSTIGCQGFIPENALYDTLCFHIQTFPRVNGSLSPVYQIHKPDIPLQRAFTLRIKPDSVAPYLTGKLLLASVDAKGNLSAAGGEWENGNITGQLRRFGSYTVALDTIPPEIIPRFKENSYDFSKAASVVFKIKDDFSGIKSYNGFIDDQWVLFEYEPKKDLIWYSFDPSRLDRNKMHQLRLEVTDGKDNQSVYHGKFYW